MAGAKGSAEASVKSLRVVIEVDAAKARQEAIAFSNFLTQRFIQAGQRTARAMGFGGLEGLKKQLGEISTIMEKTPIAKPIEVTATVDTQGIKGSVQAAGRVIKEEASKIEAALPATKPFKGTPAYTAMGPYGVSARLPGRTQEETRIEFQRQQLEHFGKQMGMTGERARALAKDLSPLLGLFQTERLKNVLGIKEVTSDFAQLQKVAGAATKTLEAIKHVPSLQKTLGLTEEQMGGLRLLSMYDVSTAKKSALEIQKIQKMSADEFEKFQDDQSIRDAARQEKRVALNKQYFEEVERSAKHATELDAERVKPIFQQEAANQRLARTYKDIADKAVNLGVITREQAAATTYHTQQLRDMVAEHHKLARATEGASHQMRQQKDVIMEQARAAGLSAGEIKKIGLASETLISGKASVGLKKLNKELSDIASGVTVKGQGTALGMPGGLAEARTTLNEYSTKLPIINTMLKEHGIVLNKLHSPLVKLAESAKNYMKFQMGWFAGAAVLMTIVGAISAAVKSFFEFEQSLKNIQAVTGASNKEINILSDAAKRLSAETPLAATEISNLGLQLMRAGLNIEETTGAMEAAAKVATISGEDMKVIGDTVASVFKVWKLGAEDATRAGTVLAAALNYSKLTIQDFGTALNYVGGMASTMGVSLEETAGVLASLSNLGIRASTMATGWRQFVAEMAAPGKKLSEFLSNATADFEKLNMIKVEGPYKLATILAELKRVGFGAQEAMALLEKRAAAFFLAIKTIGVTGLTEMIDKMKDIRAYEEGLKRVMEGPVAMLKVFRNQLLLAALNIGNALLPVLKVLIVAITLLASTLSHALSAITSMPAKIIILGVALLSVLKYWQNWINLIKNFIAINVMATFVKMRLFIADFILIMKDLIMATITFRQAWISLQYSMAVTGWGALLTIIGTLVGLALADWIMAGSNEFEKMAKSGRKVTKEMEEMNRRGQELRRQHPEVFEEIAESMEGYANAIVEYKTRINAALDVAEFKIPKMPDIREWIDENLIPAKEEIMEFRQELNRLQAEINKLESSAKKVTVWDVIKDGVKTTLEWFGLIPQGIKAMWEIFTQFLRWAAEGLKKFIDSLSKVPILGGYVNVAKKVVDETVMEFEQLPNTLNDIWKDIKWFGWEKDIERIRKEKIKDTIEQINALQAQQLDVQQNLTLAQKEFNRAVRSGDFAGMIQRLADNSRKLTAGERKELAIQGLADIMSEVAATDPDMFTAVLGQVAEAYLKAADKFDRGDKAYKRAMEALEDLMQLNEGIRRRHLQEQELIYEKEMQQMQTANARAEEEEKKRSIILKLRLDQETWMLDSFYREGLSDIDTYYSNRARIIKEGFENEVRIIREGTARLVALKERGVSYYAEKQQDVEKYVEATKKMMLKLAASQGQGLGGLVLKEKWPELISQMGEGKARDIMKSLINDLEKYQNAALEAKNKQEELKEAIKSATEESIIREDQALADNTMTILKNTEAWRKAMALEPLAKLKDLIAKEQEYNSVLLEANEIVGNWDAAQKLRLRGLQLEGEAKRADILASIQKNEADKESIKAMLVRTGLDAQQYDFYKKTLAMYDMETDSLIRQKDAWEELQRIKERRAEMMTTDTGAFMLGLEDMVAEYRYRHEEMYEIAKGTAQSAQQAWSDFFFDAMTGQLKSAEDYWKSFYNGLARQLSDFMSKRAMYGLLKALGIDTKETESEVTAQTSLTGVLGAQTGIVFGLAAAYQALALAKQAAGMLSGAAGVVSSGAGLQYQGIQANPALMMPTKHEGGFAGTYQTGGFVRPETDADWYYGPIKRQIREELEKAQKEMNKGSSGSFWSILAGIIPMALSLYGLSGGSLFGSGGIKGSYPLQSGFGAGQFNLGNYANLLTYHSGGFPRFHKGNLASDELFAILQKKEFVVSRPGVENLAKQGMLPMLASINKGTFRVADLIKMILRQQGADYNSVPMRGGLPTFHEGGYARTKGNTYEDQQEEGPQAPVIVNMNIHAIDAKSFDAMILDRKKTIAAAIMGARGDNHPVRRGR